MYHGGLYFSESDPHIQLNDVEPINEDQCKEFKVAPYSYSTVKYRSELEISE